jgi:hypothetical protein
MLVFLQRGFDGGQAMRLAGHAVVRIAARMGCSAAHTQQAVNCWI